MDIIKVVLTSLLSVGAMFIITKLMGHKQIAQLDFFDYICGITIGSISAELATNIDAPWQSLIALIIYSAASIILNLMTRKFPRTRKYINGMPSILMSDGKIYRKNLNKAKLDLAEFLLLCREQGYFNLEEIQTAVFEHNGRLTILPKSKNRPLTPNDMGISPKSAEIGTEIILDGRIIEENLKKIGRNAQWLNKRIKKEGRGSAEDIFLGIYYVDGDTLLLYSSKE